MTKKTVQENQESEKDWGIAEQNAYERLLEGSSQNVPAEEFLEWMTELEEGKDVCRLIINF